MSDLHWSKAICTLLQGVQDDGFPALLRLRVGQELALHDDSVKKDERYDAPLLRVDRHGHIAEVAERRDVFFHLLISSTVRLVLKQTQDCRARLYLVPGVSEELGMQRFFAC